jgi:hypothetical protein
MRSSVCPIVLLIGLGISNNVGLSQSIHVKEIPLLPSGTDVTYSKSRGDIRFNATGEMKSIGQDYGALLASQKWSKAAKDNLQSNFWVQNFIDPTKKLSLVVRVSKQDKGYEVRVTPTGYLWDEDLTPSPLSIPIPDAPNDLKYDDFFSRIKYKHSMSMDELVAFYQSKLDPKIWVPTETKSFTRSQAYQEWKSGTATISIRIEPDGDFRSVEIGTKGMSWDDVKKLNAAPKVAEASNKETSPPSTSSLPKRPDKPKRAIANLEKLASQCSLTVDGKLIQLNEIIAFEVVNYGQWRTNIVATATPINQEWLLKLLRSNTPEEKWGDSGWFPQPYLKIALDDKDAPISVQLSANGVVGSGSDKDVFGEAIVEDGRVRGKCTVPLDTFFDHTYQAEITFDTNLLTGSSTSAKRLANLPTLQNAGSITLGERKFNLPNVFAYQSTEGTSTVTRVVFTEKPVDLAKLKTALNSKPGELDDRFIGFQTQVKLTFSSNDELKSVYLWCDGGNIVWSGNSNVASSVQSEDGRVRGSVQTLKAEEVFGKKCLLQVTFDLSIIPRKPF